MKQEGGRIPNLRAGKPAKDEGAECVCLSSQQAGAQGGPLQPWRVLPTLPPALTLPPLKYRVAERLGFGGFLTRSSPEIEPCGGYPRSELKRPGSVKTRAQALGQGEREDFHNVVRGRVAPNPPVPPPTFFPAALTWPLPGGRQPLLPLRIRSDAPVPRATPPLGLVSLRPSLSPRERGVGLVCHSRSGQPKSLAVKMKASCPPWCVWCDAGSPGGSGLPGHPGCTRGPPGASGQSLLVWCNPGSPGGRGHPGHPGCTPSGRPSSSCSGRRWWCHSGPPGGRSRLGLPGGIPSGPCGLLIPRNKTWCDPGSPGGRGHPDHPGCTPLGRQYSFCTCRW